MFLGFHLFFLAKTTLCGSGDVITLTVFLCCQALAQDGGVHGQRSSQALKFLCCQSCSMLYGLFDPANAFACRQFFRRLKQTHSLI
jgi:hypothetical protein